jgi:flavin-dependent dehydrogenase
MQKEHYDVIIIGAGVAGGAAARFLSLHGKSVLVIESSSWPRTRETCSGIFGATFRLLQARPQDYPGELFEQPVSKIRLIFGGKAYGAFPERWIKAFYDETLYFALRGELEQWILAQSNADLCADCRVRPADLSYSPKTRRYTVRAAEKRFTSDYLIGAGGTPCSVRRRFFSVAWSPSDRVVLREAELESNRHNGEMSSYFFFNGATGFGWVYPKGRDGRLVNLGICEVGATDRINEHWRAFCAHLVREQKLSPAYNPASASGSALYLAQIDGPVRANEDTCFIVGDAAAVVHRDFWNGITPSIQSAQLAAHHIVGRDIYTRDKLYPYLFRIGSGTSPLKKRVLDLVMRRALPRLHDFLHRRSA